MKSPPLEILLVEDSPTDQLLAAEALKGIGLECNLHIVSDGVQAMEFLRFQAPFVPTRRPDLILLDLNLPRKDGREVLAEIKGDTELRIIPVVVLTTSQSSRDIEQAYALHANCFVCKPIDFIAFQEALRAIRDFWFGVVRLPDQKAWRAASEPTDVGGPR